MNRATLGLTLAALLASSIPCVGNEPEVQEFGPVLRGTRLTDRVFVENSCDRPKSVTLSSSAPWLTLPQPTVTVDPGSFADVEAVIDTSQLGQGEHRGTLTQTCNDCDECCRLDSVSIPLLVKVELPASYGSDPRDLGFHRFGHGLVDCCTLLKQIVQVTSGTTWGGSDRARGISSTLTDEYLDNGCSDLTFVPTVDDPDRPGPPPGRHTPGVDGESPKPGDGVYTRTARAGNDLVGWVYSEEIYIGIDQSTAGIWEARKRPAAYDICLLNGRLAVIPRADLVHALYHEGLHAAVGGAHNVAKPGGSGTGASNQEELDGHNAGNEACEALGLPPDTQPPNYGGQNPSYTPYSGG